MVSVWEIIQHGCLGIHDPGGPFQGPHKLHMKENLWGHIVPSTSIKLNKQNRYEKTADQNHKTCLSLSLPFFKQENQPKYSLLKNMKHQ